ncbi:NDP-sugar epimerase, includes UDP-GlcNAc-inverting 4,6-dehydratase FlaA1 and capsular polysaccharide biosynthesis protein EpsC [Parapedobacter composti]|uniref:NDP-sugar epimerase, includes UDP-GlcNAc-inverting 4,6-dehydratase FlaA1 and capsular polysaccharide biosynthesis protein EpsC n=1 Tax=Parapedobacter composti TaxID=623281 RepID=A0A1I1I6M4_9SPHI|nr:nucleoside-diphosphate sugar epimerase/dehydratase [Parapedobacter composti]SFC32079.1 NDP-sugar epimerase, includes UDP-GlcNAc-inverting 4,6-dehydratase FlaA1 and capsular polysaccharide biosynthesis protein EpsC [Parapedobacter composti]
MKDLILRFRIVPRWAILLLDLVILAWSFILSYFIANQFHFQEIIRGHFFVCTVLYSCIALPVFFLMRIHTGLIRYSDTRDMLKIFSAMLVTSAGYLMAVYLVLSPVFNVTASRLVPVILINFFIATFFLFMLRVTVKSIYFSVMRKMRDVDTIRVLIYGSDQNAIMAKQALENSKESKFIIVGFIDTNRSKLNSYIERKRVYHIKDLPTLKHKYAVDQLIFVKDHLGSRDKKVIVERCLRLGIKVLTVPPASEWVSGRLRLRQIKNLRIEDLLQRPPIKIDNDSICDDLCGKRILITGAAGSIGSEIVRQVLRYQPQMLILCDQAESPMHEVQLEIEETFPGSNVVVVIADIRNLERMHQIFNDYRPELVYHAAAYKHVPMMEKNPGEAVSTNVGGTKNVADLSVLFGVNKFVMISTDKAVNPTNVMGASKRIAEIYTQSLDGQQSLQLLDNGKGATVKGTRFITTRFGNVLGSNGSVIPRFRAQIEKGGPVTVTHPEITRYFMTIPEAVQLVLEAGTMGKGGEIYVFDMGKPVKIVDLARKMIQLAGLKPDVDVEIVYTGLRSGEKLYEELLSDGETVLPTHHDKIHIARINPMDHEYVKRAIYELLALNERKSHSGVVRKMKEIVPEFVSKNSPFEALDTVS